MRTFSKLFFILVFLGTSVIESFSQLKTPLIIQSGMVIQRDVEIPLWGSGTSNKKVYVDLNGSIDSSTVSNDGQWKVNLPAMPAGGPYELKIQSDGEELIYSDVYLGDVWLASGQSNMQMILKDSNPPDAEIDPNDNQEIRQFMVNRRLENTIKEEVPAGSAWTPATKENIENYTAVGFYFAKYLNAYLNVPIGIINTSFGGTRVESWMSEEILGYDEQDIVFGDGAWLQPTVAYNAMLHALRNVPVKGFIWYQGESNGGSRDEAILYSSSFKKLITSWRELWGFGDLPFLWVQLPNYNTPANEDSPGTWDSWALLRESQSSALELANTGEATCIDVGDIDIHPKDKQPVGKRLSLVARTLVYNDTIEYSGPRYKNHSKLGDGKVEITFDHLGGGLVAKNSDTNSLKWFSIVRGNGSLVRANAVIENDKVIVWNNSVSDPYAIRYAWETNPADVNFYNEADLPAAPFYIYVDEKDLSIGTYLAERSNINRGNSTILRWEVFGSDSILLNGIPVEMKSGLRVWPLEDSIFTLKAIDRNNDEISVSKSITISVRQPVPIIELSSISEEIISLDSTAIISATVSSEGGAPIQKVEFYLNGQLLLTQTEDPFEMEWTADTPGLFSFKGIVYNEKNISSESNTLLLNVKDLEFIKYEAEDAYFTPGGEIISNSKVSNGYYLDLQSNWTLTFDSIAIDTSGKNLIYIRYLLNHGSPRKQNLVVNDSLVENLLFRSTDFTNWQDYLTTIPMDSGLNKISVVADWGYMSFDYIILGREKLKTMIDTTTTDTSKTDIGFNSISDKIGILGYPNPFSSSSLIEFTIPSESHVNLSILDLSGRETALLANKIFQPGRHQIRFAPDTDKAGIYIVRLNYEGQIFIGKLVRLGN